MDPNPKSATAIDATNSSVSSLAYSFGQLEMNSSTEGPINRLPNEILELIMTKLGLDVDVVKLICLRRVSTRWRAVVEDYCGLKKSLIVAIKSAPSSSDYYDHKYLSKFEKRFFGFAKLSDFTRLVLTTEIPSKCLQSLLNLFPNIVQLSIYYHDQPFRIRDFFYYINSLDSLKQLDLEGDLIKALPHLSQTLSKLEHISFNNYKDTLNEDEFRLFVSHLGPNCARFFFGSYQVICHFQNQFVQWHNSNLINNDPIWLANLTHLRIAFSGKSKWHTKVVHYLIEYATSLKYFKARFYLTRLDLTPTLMRCMARKLTNLVELDLGDVVIANLLYISSNFPSLTSLVTCKLSVDESYDNAPYIDGDQLTRALSILFPNLVNLELSFDLEYFYPYFGQLKQEIEKTLYLFPKLLKHKIVSNFDDQY